MSIWDSLTSCVFFQPEYQRNAIVSMVAGILFFSGWWLLIDALSLNPEAVDAVHIIFGILGTFSMFMVNSVSQAQLDGAGFSDGCMGTRGARIFIFIGFVLGFAAVIAAVWVMVASFNSDTNKSNWPAVSILLQNVFIFIASLVYKFGRSEEMY